MPTSALHPFHRIDQLIRRRARPRPDRAPRPRRARAARLAASATALLALGTLGACTGAPAAKGPATATGSGHPAAVTVRSCGAATAVSTPPKRLVTLNEGATEVALALGLQTRMAGTAYLDDTIPARWKAAYDSVPVLSKEYPTKEKLLAAHPDFLYASYASAFTGKVAGTRAELDAEHIPSYLSPFGCADSKQVPAASFAAVWGELTDVAKVFGVTARATAIEQQQKKTLAGLAAQGAGRGLNVLWYDSDTKTPSSAPATADRSSSSTPSARTTSSARCRAAGRASAGRRWPPRTRTRSSSRTPVGTPRSRRSPTWSTTPC